MRDGIGVEGDRREGGRYEKGANQRKVQNTRGRNPAIDTTPLLAGTLACRSYNKLLENIE